MTRPLEGLTVLEFSQFLSGPYAGLRLADLGARVIKIERPEVGDLCRNLYISDTDLDNTIIIFVGDNGTPGPVAQQYHSQSAKGSLYKGGINVPMIISGNGVERMNVEEDALISTVDIFVTISELCGANTSQIHDSSSFLELLTITGSSRSHLYSEKGNNYFAVRNSTHKYMSFEDGSEALFNLQTNPFEMPNLLNPNQLPLSDNDQTNLSDLINIASQIRN